MAKSKIMVVLVVCVVISNVSFGMYDAKTGRFMQRDPIGTAPHIVHTVQGPKMVGKQGPATPNSASKDSRTSIITVNSDKSEKQQLKYSQHKSNKHDQYIDGMNLSQYVASNPIINIDPLGLSFSSCRSMLIDTVVLFRLNQGGIELDGDWVELPGGVTNDKFAHCYISCRLSQECDSLTALALGTLRELIQSFGDRDDATEDEAANMWGIGWGHDTPSCTSDDKKRDICRDGCETGGFGDPGDMWLP